MGLLKVGAIKKLFHDAGFRRVTSKSIEALESSLSGLVSEMAKDAAVVYDVRQLESHELRSLCRVKKYMVIIELGEKTDLSIEELLEEEGMPDGWDEEEEGKDEGKYDDERMNKDRERESG